MDANQHDKILKVVVILMGLFVAVFSVVTMFN